MHRCNHVGVALLGGGFPPNFSFVHTEQCNLNWYGQDHVELYCSDILEPFEAVCYLLVLSRYSGSYTSKNHLCMST